MAKAHGVLSWGLRIQSAKEAAHPRPAWEDTAWTELQSPMMVSTPGADHGVWAQGRSYGVNIQGVTTLSLKVVTEVREPACSIKEGSLAFLPGGQPGFNPRGSRELTRGHVRGAEQGVHSV